MEERSLLENQPCGHIYYCLVKFHGQNPVISKRIHMIWSLTQGQKSSSCRFCLWSSRSHEFAIVTNKKLLGVTGRTRHEACKLLLTDMVKNTGRVEQMANRYIEGEADEYSSKRAWSSIDEQYPEGLKRGVIQVHNQWSRQEQTESKWKAKG